MFGKKYCLFWIGLFMTGSIALSEDKNKNLEIIPVEESLLSIKDIQSVKKEVFNGKDALTLSLNREGSKRLKEFTTDNLGKSLAIVLNGRITSIRQIKSPIDQGKLMLTPFNDQEAKLIREMITFKK